MTTFKHGKEAQHNIMLSPIEKVLFVDIEIILHNLRFS